MTTGGAGGPLYTQPPAGGFAHYLLVTVEPDGTDFNVVEPNHLEVDHLAGNDGLRVCLDRPPREHDGSRHRGAEPGVPGARGWPSRAPTACRRPGGISRESRCRSLPHRRGSRRGDGEATLGVEVPLPKGCGVWVTVEAGAG